MLSTARSRSRSVSRCGSELSQEITRPEGSRHSRTDLADVGTAEGYGGRGSPPPAGLARRRAGSGPFRSSDIPSAARGSACVPTPQVQSSTVAGGQHAPAGEDSGEDLAMPLRRRPPVGKQQVVLRRQGVVEHLGAGRCTDPQRLSLRLVRPDHLIDTTGASEASTAEPPRARVGDASTCTPASLAETVQRGGALSTRTGVPPGAAHGQWAARGTVSRADGLHRRIIYAWTGGPTDQEQEKTRDTKHHEDAVDHPLLSRGIDRAHQQRAKQLGSMIRQEIAPRGLAPRRRGGRRSGSRGSRGRAHRRRRASSNWSGR